SVVGGGPGGFLHGFGPPPTAEQAAAAAARAAAAVASAQAAFGGGGGMIGSAWLNQQQQLSEEQSDEVNVDVSSPEATPSLMTNFAPPRRRCAPERQLTCVFCGSEDGALLDCGTTECGVGGGGCQRHGEGAMVVDEVK
ncbi:unnamed protein product, partial [Laminaria digitata]